MMQPKRLPTPKTLPAAKPTVFAGPQRTSGAQEGGGPYQSPNPIDQGNQWSFGGPNPKQFTPNRPRTVGVAGVNPRNTEPMGKGGTNKRY